MQPHNTLLVGLAGIAAVVILATGLISEATSTKTDGKPSLVATAPSAVALSPPSTKREFTPVTAAPTSTTASPAPRPAAPASVAPVVTARPSTGGATTVPAPLSTTTDPPTTARAPTTTTTVAPSTVPATTGPAPSSVPAVEQTIIEGQHEVLLLPALSAPGHPLIVYYHTLTEGADGIQTDAPKQPTVVALLLAGYAIASGDAGGPAWASDASITDYEQLTAWASAIVNPDRIYVYAESMGGVTVERAVEDGMVAPPAAIVMVSPVLSLAAAEAVAYLDPSLQAAEPLPPDPGLAPLGPLAGVPILVFASRADTIALEASNTGEFAQRDPSVQVVLGTGPHTDPSLFQPAAVVAFFAAHP